MMGKTLFDKIWDEHTICILPDGKTLLHVDRHILHDFTAPQAFAALEAKGRSVRNPELTAATEDHVVATTPGRDETTLEMGKVFLEALRKATGREGIRNFDLTDAQQGIVHVVAPELGIALPGATLACGDSHTCTVGGIGSLSIGVGTSDVEHIMATQTLKFVKPKRMRITVSGELGEGVTAKDLILHIIGTVGAAGGVGHAVEYAGEVVRALPIEARLTLCNMSIELGARTGMVAPDEKTIEYVSGRPFAPQGDELETAIAHWRTLFSDDDAVFDTEVLIDGSEIAPTVTWGTSPEDAITVTGVVPDPAEIDDAERRIYKERALGYMGLTPGTAMDGLAIDRVFIGSCTNSRIEDLRSAAAVAKGRHVPDGVKAMVVPGSASIKREAEAEGLDRIFMDAGFEWHESACSLCCALGDDLVSPSTRCVSTSNRNFENRQGPGARTHLASPAMAAAAAVSGKIVDVRKI
ncbi:MAG: 3-isopropylmalate dehydratase large subunit, partial [Alphaproteobacteria bacterium]|nr:3-isopropylmalate dehydratase large subunit [Alphaproteobacteria bacterium]